MLDLASFVACLGADLPPMPLALWLFLPFWLVFAAFTQGAIGFGYAVLVMGVLPLFLDIRLVNLLVTISILPMLIWATSAYFAHLERRDVTLCLVGMACGLPVGLVFFTYVPAIWLTLGTAVAVLVVGVDGLTATVRETVSRAERPLLGLSLITGVLSGILSGALGIGGPPLAALAVRQPWPPLRAKAFMTTCFLAQVIMKSAALFATGWLDGPVLKMSAMAAPLGFLGMWAGARISRNLDRQRFRQLASLMLILLAITLLVRSAPLLLASAKTSQVESSA